MRKNTTPAFHSILGHLMDKFLQEKQACGCRCRGGSFFYLRHLDTFLLQEKLDVIELPRELVERWLVKRPNEKPVTLALRRSTVRQFAFFLFHRDVPAYIPPTYSGPIIRKDFVARIYSKDEMRRIFIALDSLPLRWSPISHLVLPELFRLLYSCGLRVSEALHLQVKDVDLVENILFIRDSKFGKDRLVPVAPPMAERLRRYVVNIEVDNPDAFFFPAPSGNSYHVGTIYYNFRNILRKAKIPHGGKGCGPRVHDFRHTYAVHRLIQWYREGADISLKLPILSTYLGHKSLKGTQKYLQLTVDLLPELTKKIEKDFGHVIPGGDGDETD